MSSILIYNMILNDIVFIPWSFQVIWCFKKRVSEAIKDELGSNALMKPVCVCYSHLFFH